VKKSDISSDIITHSPNSASVSNDWLASVTSNGTYGFVHRNGTNILPQRSLESPGMSRMCDILLDLERSSGSRGEEILTSRAPDLMTKSYHDHYHDVPWVDDRMRMLHVSAAAADADWRRDAMLAAQVPLLTCIGYYVHDADQQHTPLKNVICQKFLHFSHCHFYIGYLTEVAVAGILQAADAVHRTRTLSFETETNTLKIGCHDILRSRLSLGNSRGAVGFQLQLLSMNVIIVCRRRHGQSREPFRAQTRHISAHIVQMASQLTDILAMSVPVAVFSGPITCPLVKKTHTVCSLISHLQDNIGQ